MKKLLIVADYNDADYVKDIVNVEDSVFEKFLPFMKAINNFEPYVRHHRIGGICEHNWISSREDIGEKNIYEAYPQFNHDYIDEFISIFTSGLNVPYDDWHCHTIIEISDIVTDEKYVDWEQDWKSCEKRYSPKVKEYLKKRKELYSYKRPSDGKPINCIPFTEMNDYENELIYKLNTLWKDYQ